MLISLVALMEAEQAGSIPLTTGELMQGALFQRLEAIDAASAVALHGGKESQQQLYTISPLICDHEELQGRELRIAQGDRTWFRVTGLNTEVSELLLRMAERTRYWEIGLTRPFTRFRINYWKARASEHPWAGQINIDELWQSAFHAMNHQPDRIWFDFETPTGFDGPAGRWPTWNHLPHAESVFKSLLRRQKILLPALGGPAGEVPLETAVGLGEYKIQSHMLHFKQHNARESGFTGSCEYLIHPAAKPAEIFWLHLLAGLAFYAGVGMKTSWGMGMTRRSRYREFTYRGAG